MLNNRGFTLLEILIALLIVSIGLLGVATLQVRGQQINYVSYYRTQAAFLAGDIMERMQVNPSEATKGSYILADLPTCPNAGDVDTTCDTGTCNPAALANYDLANWCFALRNTLPMADARIRRSIKLSDPGDPSSPPDLTSVMYTITICWANILGTEVNGVCENNKEEQTWFHMSPEITE